MILSTMNTWIMILNRFLNPFSMKYVLFILLASPVIAFSQKDSIVTYIGVVKIDSASKSDLYNAARQWFNYTFKDSKSVLQIQDKDAGQLSGKAASRGFFSSKVFGVSKKYPASFEFSIDIWVKDGKYKYQIFNIDNYQTGKGNGPGLGILTSSETCPKKYPMTTKKRMNSSWASIKEAFQAD